MVFKALLNSVKKPLSKGPHLINAVTQRGRGQKFKNEISGKGKNNKNPSQEHNGSVCPFGISGDILILYYAVASTTADPHINLSGLAVLTPSDCCP